MQSWRHRKAAGRGVIFVTSSPREAAYKAALRLDRVRRTAMDLSTKLKITAVMAAVLMAVLWTVPVPV
jgi:hypothetical protein